MRISVIAEWVSRAFWMIAVELSLSCSFMYSEDGMVVVRGCVGEQGKLRRVEGRLWETAGVYCCVRARMRVWPKHEQVATIYRPL